MKKKLKKITHDSFISNVNLFDFYLIDESDDKDSFKRLPLNIEIMTKKLQVLARKYRSVLKEMEDAYIEYRQEWVIAEPTVYVARTKDKKTEIEYFTAKTTWPLIGGKTKEVKIYLGKASDFGNDTQSIKAKELAKEKMSDTLRRRKDNGEI